MSVELLPRLIVLLGRWGFGEFWSETLARCLLGILLLLLAVVFRLLIDRVVYRILNRLARHTMPKWVMELWEKGIHQRLLWLVPVLVVRFFAPIFLDGLESFLDFVRISTSLAIVATVSLTLISFLRFLNLAYSRRIDAKNRPIKGVVQAAQVILIVGAGILGFSIITGKPVSGLFTGLGAISAVLMLVFKDPLLGLVSGFQISSNDTVRLGDWIEMPTHGADGDVIDISLLTVTVKNWDNTLITFPIQALTTGAVKNWRGMTKTGSRRIKRSLSIDLLSIRFLSKQDMAHLSSIDLIKVYLAERSEEIDKHNKLSGVNRGASAVNGRGLTNIGVFRNYAQFYIRSHPLVNSQMTLMVRQLQSGPEGLPLEIYLFATETNWVRYEEIQADIFDHLIATLPEFGLRLFQRPSGESLKALTGRIDQALLQKNEPRLL